MRSLYLTMFFAFVLTQAQAGELKTTFIGNAAVEITDGTNSLYVDFPYESGTFGYMTYDSDLLKKTTDSVCLFTHSHADHFSPALLPKFGCKILGPKDVLDQTDPQKRLSWNDGRAEINHAMILAIETPHGSVPHFSYRIEWNGKKFYFTGDTDATASLTQESGLDMLFITPWLLEQLTAGTLSHIAKKVVVYHHRTNEKISCSNCMVPLQRQVIAF